MTDNAFVWSYITLTAVLLTLCLDWGLPSERNRDLLLFNQDFNEKQIALLDDLRVSLRAANALAREKNLREQVVSVRGRENTEPLLSYSDKLEEFWSFMTNSANADERKPYTALSAMNPATLDFNPRLFIYGGAFLYPLGGALYLSSALGLISVDRSTVATVADPDNIAAIYVVGRSMSMVAFLVTLALTHRLGKRLGGAPAGVFAMVLFSISHVALNQSVVTKPHVYAACFSLLSVLCALKYLDGSSRRHLVLSSVFCGVAIGSFLPCALILLVNACLLFNAGDGHKSLKTLGVLFAGSFVVVILTNPYFVLDLDRFIHTVRIHGSSEGWGYTAISLRKLLAYAVDMMFSYGFLLSVLVPYGMVLASKTRVEPFRRLALSTFVVFLLAGTTLGNSRLTVFLGPLLCLFAGYGAQRLISLRPGSPVMARVGLLVLALPAVYAAALFYGDTIRDDYWYEDTREWVLQQPLREGTSAGVFHLSPRNLPPFPFLDTEVVDLGTAASASLPVDYVILGNYHGEHEVWDNHPLRSEYELDRVLGGRAERHPYARRVWRNQARISAWVYRRTAGPVAAP